MSPGQHPPVPSVWRSLAWALRPGAEGRGISRGGLLLRALVACSAHPTAMRRWLGVVWELHSRGLVADPGAEFLRAVRPYVMRHTHYNARVLQLIEHVDWMDTAFKPRALERLAAGEALVLADLSPPRGYDFLRLELRRAPPQSPEGELLLSLVLQRSADVQHKAVPLEAAVVAFSVFRIEGTSCMAIGGVRGARHPVQRVSAVELAQVLAGWKPAVLMVRVAQELARFWGLRLVGLNPSSHRLQHWTFQMQERYRERMRRIQESHDALWDYFGATRGPTGWMVLPLDSDDKLAATALSPEKRERQIRRADFWMRARRRLHADAGQLLERPGREARLSRITQSLQPSSVADWEHDRDDGDPGPPGLLQTGPASLG